MTTPITVQDWHPGIPTEYQDNIVAGDALDCLRRLPDESVPLFLFSPPYNLGTSTGGGIQAYRSHYAAYEAAETDWAQLGQRETPPTTTQPPKKRPDLFTIPMRTKPQRCNCGAEFYWVVVNDKPIPVSINTDLHPDCLAPTRDQAGAGINHFADCPNRDRHRKAKPSALSHPLDQPQPQPTTTEAA